ncbi:hypothetical protein CBW18_10885, partial [Pedobacter sp. AJM]
MLSKIEKLIDELSLRLVLTAHPTQFYPGNVLAIITDLTHAIRENNITSMNSLLQQLGKTPFFNKKSPTPVEKKNADNKPMLSKIEKLIDELSLRLVLTAHPTQFYPGNVLAIITDLTHAIRENNITSMNSLLQQLGKTPFFNKKSPTPVDEALNLAWFLENTFYFAAANIQAEIDQNLDEYNLETKKILELGFWPGGDRDGNPNIHVDTTLEVSKMLRQILFRCYYRDFRVIKRRITFRGVEENIANLHDVLYKNAFDHACESHDISDELKENLNKIKDTGTLLPLFFKSCEEGILNGQKPAQVIEEFFAKYTHYTERKDIIDLLFRFIQYIERQVVLFDAVEDASFTKLNTTDEQSTLAFILKKNADNKPMLSKIEKLIDELSLRLVLTAHPT